MSEKSDMEERRAGFRVYGRVQGVGFRWWTRQTAESLGLTGLVRNLPDGSVEVRAAGPTEALRELESLLQRGPGYAFVRRLERFPVDEVPIRGFRIEL